MFKGNGFFLGTVSEIRIGAKNNKNRRCIYNDGDCEDLSLKQIQTLSRLYPLPRYFKKIETTIEYDTDNIPLDSTVKNKSKPPDTSSNTDTSTEYPKSDILDHHISFISQNMQSLRSDS